MNRKQRTTLNNLFATPIRRNIKWLDVVSLIGALNGEVIEGSGARARFHLNDVSLNIHSPHPRPELKIYRYCERTPTGTTTNRIGQPLDEGTRKLARGYGWTCTIDLSTTRAPVAR